MNDWTSGGVSNKSNVEHACEAAMLQHVEKLMLTALSLPDEEGAKRFETGLTRTRRLDRVMRDIVEKVYAK
jgi:hypothetical protein